MHDILRFTDLSPEMRDKILKGVLKVYRDCNITSLPIDCFEIINHYSFKLYSYTELREKNLELYEICKSWSNDAFSWNGIIAYNERILPSRIRFSLLHELGHYILNIPSTSQAFESIVDYFTSYLLAPRVLIHKCGYGNSDQIRNAFNISTQAANNALIDYKIWFQYICRTTREISKSEIELEQIFFPEVREEAKSKLKRKARLSPETERCISFFDDLSAERGGNYMFRRAESQWLYGNDY